MLRQLSLALVADAGQQAGVIEEAETEGTSAPPRVEIQQRGALVGSFVFGCAGTSLLFVTITGGIVIGCLPSRASRAVGEKFGLNLNAAMECVPQRHRGSEAATRLARRRRRAPVLVDMMKKEEEKELVSGGFPVSPRSAGGDIVGSGRKRRQQRQAVVVDAISLGLSRVEGG
ncbi:hypothetical protein PG988_000038 [Apiospora saccharicola]